MVSNGPQLLWLATVKVSNGQHPTVANGHFNGQHPTVANGHFNRHFNRHLTVSKAVN